jgi:hypothetical protein
MSRLRHREWQYIIDSSGPAFGTGTVTAYRVGAQVRTTTATNTVFPVYEGHGFKAGDKFIVTNTAGTNFASLRYSTVSTVTKDEITISTAAISVTEGELLINLDADTGSGPPNYDASPIKIFETVYDFKTYNTFPTAVTQARLTISSAGRYRYWTADQRVWELIRDGEEDPVLLLPDVMPDTEVQRVLDVRQFGARGNNSTDDTVAIQAAIDAARDQGSVSGPTGISQGGTVYFPGGVYLITDTLVLGNCVSLVGSATDAAVIYADFDDDDMAILQAPAPAYSTTLGDRTFNVLIERISFTKTGTGSDWIGIDLSQVSMATVRKCTVRGTGTADGGIGIKVGNIAYTNRIEDATVSSCTTGILVANGGNGTTLQNCYAVTTTTAIHLHAGPDADLIDTLVEQCRLEGFTTGVKLDVENSKGMANILIVGGHIEGGTDGIHVASSGVSNVLILSPRYSSLTTALNDAAGVAVDWVHPVGIRGLRIGEKTSTGGVGKALAHWSDDDEAVLFRTGDDADSADLGVPWWKPGQVVRRQYAEVQTTTASIPRDDTIPQNTEGTQMMIAAITPSSSGSILRVRASAMIAGSAASDAQMALFRGSTADAFAAVSQRLVASGESYRIEVETDLWADAVTDTLVSARLGVSSGTLTLNGSAGSRLFGTTSRSLIEVVEYRPPKSTLTTWADVLRTLPVLLLYLADDLSAGAVSTWTDKGPYGYDLTQATGGNQPTCVANVFNGKNVVRFDGTSDYLDGSGVIGPEQAHLFQVLKIDTDPGTSNKCGWGVWPEGGGNDLYTWTDGHIYHQFARNTRYDLGDPTATLTTQHLFEVASTPAHWIARINGTQQGSTETSGAVSWDTTPRLGAHATTPPGRYFDGDVGCFLVLHKELGTYWAGELRSFLYSYYGITP